MPERGGKVNPSLPPPKADSEPDARARCGFSIARTMRLFGCGLSLIWFFLILYFIPSNSPRHSERYPEIPTAITLVATCILLSSIRGWRMHVLAMPLWCAVLWW